MVSNASQIDLEKPAKVYQLNTVEAKVDSALSKLDTLITQTSGLATTEQLSAAILESERKTDLKYGPLKRSVNKFVWLLISGLVTIVTQGVIIYVIATGK